MNSKSTGTKWVHHKMRARRRALTLEPLHVGGRPRRNQPPVELGMRIENGPADGAEDTYCRCPLDGREHDVFGEEKRTRRRPTSPNRMLQEIGRALRPGGVTLRGPQTAPPIVEERGGSRWALQRAAIARRLGGRMLSGVQGVGIVTSRRGGSDVATDCLGPVLEPRGSARRLSRWHEADSTSSSWGARSPSGESIDSFFDGEPLPGSLEKRAPRSWPHGGSARSRHGPARQCVGRAAAARARRSWRVDVLVNNAIMSTAHRSTMFTSIFDERFQREMQVKFFGELALIRRATHMLETGGAVQSQLSARRSTAPPRRAEVPALVHGGRPPSAA